MNSAPSSGLGGGTPDPHQLALLLRLAGGAGFGSGGGGGGGGGGGPGAALLAQLMGAASVVPGLGLGGGGHAAGGPAPTSGGASQPSPAAGPSSSILLGGGTGAVGSAEDQILQRASALRAEAMMQNNPTDKNVSSNGISGPSGGGGKKNKKKKNKAASNAAPVASSPQQSNTNAANASTVTLPALSHHLTLQQQLQQFQQQQQHGTMPDAQQQNQLQAALAAFQQQQQQQLTSLSAFTGVGSSAAPSGPRPNNLSAPPAPGGIGGNLASTPASTASALSVSAVAQHDAIIARAAALRELGFSGEQIASVLLGSTAPVNGTASAAGGGLGGLSSSFQNESSSAGVKNGPIASPSLNPNSTGTGPNQSILEQLQRQMEIQRLEELERSRRAQIAALTGLGGVNALNGLSAGGAEASGAARAKAPVESVETNGGQALVSRAGANSNNDAIPRAEKTSKKITGGKYLVNTNMSGVDADMKSGFWHEKDNAVIVPCKARGMPMDHTFKTAYFVISEDVKHGDDVICSYPACRKGGVKFRYCGHCLNPVAKRNFSRRHHHGAGTTKNNVSDGDAMDEDDTTDDDADAFGGDDGDYSQKEMKGMNAAVQKATKRKRGSDKNNHGLVISDARKSLWSQLLARRPRSKDPRNLSSWLNEVLSISDFDVSIDGLLSAAAENENKKSQSADIKDDPSDKRCATNRGKEKIDDIKVKAKKIKTEETRNKDRNESSAKLSKSLDEANDVDSPSTSKPKEEPQEKKVDASDKPIDEDKKDETPSISSVKEAQRAKEDGDSASKQLDEGKKDGCVSSSTVTEDTKKQKETCTEEIEDTENKGDGEADPSEKPDENRPLSNPTGREGSKVETGAYLSEKCDEKSSASKSEEKDKGKDDTNDGPSEKSDEKRTASKPAGTEGDKDDEGFASSSFADWKKSKKSLKKGSSLRK